LFEKADIFIFLKFNIFLVFFNYLKICVNANGRTDTKRERKLFLIFLENECYTMQTTGHTQKRERKNFF